MAETEQNRTKVFVGASLDPDIYTVVERFRIEEDRNMSNMIERLLKTHPRVQEVLEAETASAAN